MKFSDALETREDSQKQPLAERGRRTAPIVAPKPDPLATWRAEADEIPPPPAPPTPPPFPPPPRIGNPHATQPRQQSAAPPPVSPGTAQQASPATASEATTMLATQHHSSQIPTQALPSSEPGLVRRAALDEAGKYEYLGEIGSGGMGRVISVRDRLLRRPVAMKLINAGKDGKHTQALTERFLAEAQTTGQLEHPNIVPIHDLGVMPDGKYFFTMKLIRGETLRDVFDRLGETDQTPAEKYTLPRLLAVLQQIANGLGFAHARGVIHRDLKPENVMLGEFGEVLIMDWGLAKLKRTPHAAASKRPAAGLPAAGLPAVDGEFWKQLPGEIDSQAVERTRVGTIAGTPGYMAPEQARGEVDRIDERTDVFALGVLLYELLTGTPPHNQKDAKKRVEAAATGQQIESPAARLRKTQARGASPVPRELAAIAMKALAPEAANRYGSAQEFGEELQRYLERRPVTACPDTIAQRTVKWARRNRAMVGAAAAVLCALIVAGVAVRSYISNSMIRQYATDGRRLVAAAKAEREKQLQQLPAADPSDPYADLSKKRAFDSIDERYTAQLARGAEVYSRIFDYDSGNAAARGELAQIYLEMWRAAVRRGQPELTAAYAQDVAYHAGPKEYQAHYRAEIDGDGKLTLGTNGVAAQVFLFRFVETGRWNRLTPAPYQLTQRTVAEAGLAETVARLRAASDAGDGGQLAHLNFDARHGHLLGATPIKLDPMPVGSYLLVLRAPGYEDLRLPVTIARQKDLTLNVKLIKTGEQPAGFTYVPSVWARLGGPSAGSRWPNYAWKESAAFFIQTHEVTFGQYEDFLKGLLAEGRAGEAAERLPRDFGFTYLQIAGGEIKAHESLTEGWRKWPVRGVSWMDAQAYSAWRSRRDGVPYRLPTELEWEVAARGTDGRRYTWGEVFWPQAARLSQGYGAMTNLQAEQASRTKQSADESVFGVWDLTGSQTEWCADEFNGRPGERVLRGNAWALQPVGLEAAFRTSGPPDYFHATTGFRLALDAR
jgi:eukaryotic-like serine/threonine-protein kinase